jgi:hypothetical protein
VLGRPIFLQSASSLPERDVSSFLAVRAAAAQIVPETALFVLLAATLSCVPIH